MENTNSETNFFFKQAISAIRSGETDKGLDYLNEIQGLDVFKNVAKAEIAYYRNDLKNAMYFDEHSISSDGLWYEPGITVQHLRAYVHAAKTLGSISRAKEFLDYYISEKRREYDVVGIRPYNKLYNNAMKRLDNLETDDNPPEISIITKENADCEFKFFRSDDDNLSQKETAQGASVMLNFMWNKAETKSTLEFYESYADYITLDLHHIWAARNYIKLNMPEMAENAIMRYVKTWTPSEKFQVMPMKIFIYNDIIDFLTPELKEKIINTPKLD